MRCKDKAEKGNVKKSNELFQNFGPKQTDAGCNYFKNEAL
jgi:hypothetical protein